MSINKSQNIPLVELGNQYRQFVKRQLFLGRWPFQNDEERKAAWLEWKMCSVYKVAE